jgi:hypothetical protein
MLTREIQHLGRDSLRQLTAAPPVLHPPAHAIHRKDLKVPQAFPSPARPQHIQSGWETWARAFAGSRDLQQSSELFTQPLPPADIFRVPHHGRSDLLTLLRDAAEIGDAERFSDLCESTNWKARSPSEVAKAIDLALRAGALMTARCLAREGACYNPGSKDLGNYAHLLAPPEVLRTDLPPDPTLEADLEWFKRNGTTYRGRWVALHRGKLIAEGSTLKKMLTQIGKRELKGLLLTRVR